MLSRTNGPAPTQLESLANLDRSPAGSKTCFGTTDIQKPTPSANGAYGCESLNFTVVASGASTDSTQVSFAATLPSLYFMIDSAENFTSSATTGLPSVHLKSSRSTKTAVLPSSS